MDLHLRDDRCYELFPDYSLFDANNDLGIVASNETVGKLEDFNTLSNFSYFGHSKLVAESNANGTEDFTLAQLGFIEIDLTSEKVMQKLDETLKIGFDLHGMLTRLMEEPKEVHFESNANLELKISL